ncbi:MAG: hypothetical protein QOD63_368 [Actinomycetota bacterium]|nr:hypothetical protein [Actinomycetota bacterium]
MARAAPLVAGMSLVTTGLVLPAQRAPSVPDVKAKAQALADSVVGPGFSRQVETGIEAEMVGFEWAGRTPGAVEVRTRDGDEPGPWVEVHGDPFEGPDVGSPEYSGKTTAGPVWLGSGTKDVEVRVTEGDLPELKLHAIHSETPKEPSGPTTTRAGADIAKPAIVTRAAWGADESFRTINPGCNGSALYAERVSYAVVHHTATANTYTAAEAPAVVRGIYYFHTHTNGWCDIGYNFLVDRFGTTYEGRAGGMSEAVIGAHAQGFNTESTGAAIIGTFTTEEVPNPAYSALRELLAWRLAWAGVDPQATLTVGGKTIATITGHRDVNNTDCPGDKLEVLLSGLRGDLAVRLRASMAKPAVQRAVDGTIYQRSTQTSGTATSAFGYGNLGDIAMMCDWDGDGVPTIGVHRQGNGHFYLRNANTTGVADIEFVYGNPGDIPVCGDWNGDGVDTVGVVRSGTWYLKNDHLGGVADVTYVYGNPNDRAFVGDWNGDGIDTPGVQRDGPWYLRNSNSSGVADQAPFGYGNPGDKPVAGDWNGDGIDTVGVVRAGTFYLRDSNTTGRADSFFTFGNPADQPLFWR